MKFNVGDIVIGNSFANRYAITNEGWIGVVVEVREEDFSATSLDMISRGLFGGLNYDCFDLYRGRPYEIQSNFGLRLTTPPSIQFSPFIDDYKPQYKVEKIIFNKPATIVFAKGNKYKVKASIGEKFDKEKGLALALLKMFGISYPDLKRMIKNADDQDAKKKKEKKKNGRK